MNEKMTYVCILSAHNVAEALAVCQQNPAHVIGILSKKFNKTQGAAKRWQSVIERVAGVQVTLMGEELGGDDYEQTIPWLQEHLVPLLQKTHDEKDHKIICNLTGGTKTTAIAVEKCFNWDECHYTPMGSCQVHRWKGSEMLPKILTQALDPLDHAYLYVDTLEEDSAVYIGSKEQKLKVASLINQAIVDQNPAYAKYCEITERLGRPEQKTKDDGSEESVKEAFARVAQELGVTKVSGKKLEIPISVFGEYATGIREVLCPAFDLENAGLVDFTGDVWVFPHCAGKAGGTAKEWVKYVSGGWYEDYIENLIRIHTHVPICTNVEFKNGDTKYESDLLVQCGGNLHVVECKVTIPKTGSLRAIAEHLESSAKVLGMPKKIFTFSEAFKRDVTGNRYEDFKSRCKATGTNILIGDQAVIDYFTQEAGKYDGIHTA